MKNKKRMIFKIVLIIIALLLIYKAYDLMKTEDVYIKEKVEVELNVPQNDIITSGQETIIKTFNNIIDVHWLNNDELFVEGQVQGKLGQYVFDVNKQVLEVYQSGSNTSKPYEETFITLLNNNKSLYMEEGSLVLKIDKDKKVVVDDEILGSQPLYQLSDNKTKLLFYNAQKNSLVTYNFQKDFYRTVYNNVSDLMLDNFYALVKISPQGGYVSVESKTENLLEHNFSLYGADSGKLYVENVHGVDLAWSKDDKYLTYYYTKESEALNAKNNSFKSKRMAYYDIDQKEINFIDSTNTEFEMISDMYWYENQVMVLIGSAEDYIKVNGLWIYDFTSDSFKEVPLALEVLDLDTKFDFIMADPIFFLIINGISDHQIVKINMLTHEYDLMKNLKNFDVEGKENAFYYHNENNLLTYDEEKLTLSHGQQERYAYIEQGVFKVFPNPDLNKIAVLLSNKNIIKLLEID